MHCFFSNILCIVSTILFCLFKSTFAVCSSTEPPADETFHSCFETETVPSLLPYSKESERINFQIERYDRLFLENPIISKEDFLHKNISEFIEIALSGIEYVQHYYQQKSYSTIRDLSAENQTVILEQCHVLKNEIDNFIKVKRYSELSVGLTAAEFMSFNFKLATLQTITPSSFSSFRKDKEPYNILLLHPFYDVDFWVKQQETPAFSDKDEEDIFFCNPYVIYTPGGAFRIHRLVCNILSTQHHYSLLMGLPIGEINIHNSPHNDYYRDPVEFLNHDFQHARLFFSRREDFEIFKVGRISSHQTLDLKNPCIELAAFYAFHEDDFAAQSIFSCLLLETSMWGEPPLKALNNTKNMAIKDYLSFYGYKHGRRKLTSISNYQLELETIVYTLALEHHEPTKTREAYYLQKTNEFHIALRHMYKDRQGEDFTGIFSKCDYYWYAFANYLRYEVGLIIAEHINHASK